MVMETVGNLQMRMLIVMKIKCFKSSQRIRKRMRNLRIPNLCTKSQPKRIVNPKKTPMASMGSLTTRNLHTYLNRVPKKRRKGRKMPNSWGNEAEVIVVIEVAQHTEI